MQQAGTSNKNWGPSGINYTGLTARIHGIEKHSGTDQHQPLLQMGKAAGETNHFFFIDM